jgi:hypothetical protein
VRLFEGERADRRPPGNSPQWLSLQNPQYKENIMENETASFPTVTQSLVSDFGTFEGFNFRTQSAIDRTLTAQEVVAWDHDREGEAEFWPSGDSPEVALLFKQRSSVTASELLDLDRVLLELGDDSRASFLQIYYAVEICGAALQSLTAEQVQDNNLQVFFGSGFVDLRRATAYELFELYYPEEYRIWEQSHCDGLIFDTDLFLDSPVFWVEEVELGDEVALLVAAN